jgi:hypothetical protein
MLNCGKKIRALRNKKNEYSNSCVVRKKSSGSERNNPPFKLNGRSLTNFHFHNFYFFFALFPRDVCAICYCCMRLLLGSKYLSDFGTMHASQTYLWFGPNGVLTQDLEHSIKDKLGTDPCA